jgi:hypothetical protein
MPESDMSAAPAVEKNGALITVFCAESLRLIALRAIAISLLTGKITGNLRNRCCQDLIRPVFHKNSKDLRANSLLGRAGNFWIRCREF